MAMRVYVGRVPVGAGVAEVATAFAAFGTVAFVEVARRDGRSHHAFVQFVEVEAAARACAAMDGKPLAPAFEQDPPIRVGAVKSSATSPAANSVETLATVDMQARPHGRKPPSSPVPVAVVLVGVQYPSNVGAVARLCRVFNVARLLVVKPNCDVHHADAQLAATHGQWYLENMVVLDDISELHSHCSYAAGFTARITKNISRTPFTLAQFAANAPTLAALGKEGAEKLTGLVFGRESDGLANEELNCCDAVVTIPIVSENPVLNVSHAAGIALYEGACVPNVANAKLPTVCEKITSATQRQLYTPASHDDVAELERVWRQLADSGPHPQPSVQAMHNIVGRAVPSAVEAAAVTDTLAHAARCVVTTSSSTPNH
eukprot:TRINITY_DN1855_c0_g1_i1.p1 TRINITY_DN1855_c0_g1~~TRINITY_DN1855_c0_g1_i1.p1  ORF type:complete len:387 (-),score=75.82 TRINITY_DN1855_c0_g1_i1:55-1176(-)